MTFDELVEIDIGRDGPKFLKSRFLDGEILAGRLGEAQPRLLQFVIVKIPHLWEQVLDLNFIKVKQQSCFGMIRFNPIKRSSRSEASFLESGTKPFDQGQKRIPSTGSFMIRFFIFPTEY